MSYDFTAKEQHTIQWAEIVMCSLSMIGSATILLSFRGRPCETFPDRCLLYMALLDFVLSFWVF